MASLAVNSTSHPSTRASSSGSARILAGILLTGAALFARLAFLAPFFVDLRDLFGMALSSHTLSSGLLQPALMSNVARYHLWKDCAAIIRGLVRLIFGENKFSGGHTLPALSCPRLRVPPAGLLSTLLETPAGTGELVADFSGISAPLRIAPWVQCGNTSRNLVDHIMLHPKPEGYLEASIPRNFCDFFEQFGMPVTARLVLPFRWEAKKRQCLCWSKVVMRKHRQRRQQIYFLFYCLHCGLHGDTFGKSLYVSA